MTVTWFIEKLMNTPFVKIKYMGHSWCNPLINIAWNCCIVGHFSIENIRKNQK